MFTLFPLCVCISLLWCISLYLPFFPCEHIHSRNPVVFRSVAICLFFIVMCSSVNTFVCFMSAWHQVKLHYHLNAEGRAVSFIIQHSLTTWADSILKGRNTVLFCTSKNLSVKDKVRHFSTLVLEAVSLFSFSMLIQVVEYGHTAIYEAMLRK